MATLLETLLEDHRDAERLLGALERHMEIFAAGGAPDYDVIAGAAEYFVDYPDLRHHPLEDAIAARLLASHPLDAAAVADLAGEHTVARDRARRFRRTMIELLRDTDIARDDVVLAARRFTDFERRHMQMEEAVLFPLAARLLSAADWAAIEAQVSAASDPVFGAEVAASFGLLRDRLMRWDTEDQLMATQGAPR